MLAVAAALAACRPVSPELAGLGARAPRAAFQGIGDLPGGQFHSEVLALSDDGRVLAGRSHSAHAPDEGFVRDARGALFELLGPAGTRVGSEARALTPTGRVAGGKFVGADQVMRAARWTRATGWVALPDLSGGADMSQALGISADGSVLVGWGSMSAGLVATRWVNGVVSSVGDLPGGVVHSAAALVSWNGTVIVGTGNSASGPEVFVWRQGLGMTGLGDLPGGAFSSEPFGMTLDASVIVGEATSTNGIEAFRWTQAGGMEGLGDLPGGEFQSMAFDCSARGEVVVGFGTTAEGAEAFLWDRVRGMRRVEDALVALGLDAVVDWRLTEVTGISADGRMLAGNGINPQGQSEGWVARLW